LPLAFRIRNYERKAILKQLVVVVTKARDAPSLCVSYANVACQYWRHV
jgi:hypothetical protein